MGKKFHGSRRGGGHNNRGHQGDSNGGAYSRGHGRYFNKPNRQRQENSEKGEQIVKVTLQESQVGITEYVSSGKGFTGVLKARYSDFHVNEIDLDGKVLQLNDMTIPTLTEAEPTISQEDLEALKTEVSAFVSEEAWKQMEEIAKGKRAKPVEIDVTDLSKKKRTAIHTVIKKVYEKKCNSCTVTRDVCRKAILVKHADRKPNRRPQWLFPGDYVHFLIYKENMDTSEVAVILANALRVKPSQVNYCGTKDKRGKTTQKFCVKRRQPYQIFRAVKSINGVKIGDFSFHGNVIKLGELKGNRFRIVLRHITGDRKEIVKSLQSIKEFGFINYYGLQRFGNNASIPTYEVGVALLKNDYKTACELILKPRDNDIPFMRSIRAAWWEDRDATAAAAMFHSDRFIEKKLLDGLSEYGPNDYANALRKIPRNMLLLYTHAYQSLIFNRIASKRIKQHGLKLIVGDLVYRDQDAADQVLLDVEDVDEEVDEEVGTKDEDSKPKDEDSIPKDEDSIPKDEDSKPKDEDSKPKDEDSQPKDEDSKPKDEDSKPKDESAFKQKVKALSEEDISSGKYTIFDVVLPLPGHDITYPANEIGKWYEEMLAEESLNSEKLKNNVKTYSLGGAYRKLLIKPDKMSWYFKKYKTPEEDVIPSHFETTETPEVPPEGEGKFTALVLDFCLPPSVYATMCLREILKNDTSSTNQANLGRSEMEKFEEKTRADANEKNEATMNGKKNGEAPAADDTTVEVKKDMNGESSGLDHKIAEKRQKEEEKKTVEEQEEPDVKKGKKE